MKGPNNSELHLAVVLGTDGPTFLVMEFEDERDGFDVFVNTPNNIEETRKAIGLNTGS